MGNKEEDNRRERLTQWKRCGSDEMKGYHDVILSCKSYGRDWRRLTQEIRELIEESILGGWTHASSHIHTRWYCAQLHSLTDADFTQQDLSLFLRKKKDLSLSLPPWKWLRERIGFRGTGRPPAISGDNWTNWLFVFQIFLTWGVLFFFWFVVFEGCSVFSLE